MARKILNSPNHAEPCLVAAAKKVLLPDNWVFLHGKAHADYRKALKCSLHQEGSEVGGARSRSPISR